MQQRKNLTHNLFSIFFSIQDFQLKIYNLLPRFLKNNAILLDKKYDGVVKRKSICNQQSYL